MSDIREVAKQYIENGWAVVPLNPGEKAASVAWARTTYRPDHFNDDSNIAVKLGDPSDGLVDVDCDSPHAVAAARLLLPVTGTRFGRASKPDSHYLYRCPDIKTVQLRNVDGSMVIELRSTGGYTMFPPSLHPSGETVEFTERNQILDMDAALQDRVVDVYIAAMVTERWHALHHQDMGDLAGFLLRAGFTGPRLLDLFHAIGKLAPGGFENEIVTFARSTIDRLERGEPVTGGPKLEQVLGKDVVTKFRAALKQADADALESFNARHFVVRLGKDTVIGREDDPDEIVFQTAAALRLEYANKFVQVGADKNCEPIFAPLFDTWLRSTNRRGYRRVVFSPPPISPAADDFNLWRGFGVEPNKVADSHLVLPFLEHLRHVVCGNDPECYEYTMNLLARTVQRPGEPGQVAMIMRGRQGAGKGVIIEDGIGPIVGRPHYAHIVKSEQVIGRFNKAISGKVVVFLDEAFWAGDKREHGAFKALITERSLMVEPKGIDPFTVDNFAHVFCATNEDWAVPAELDDRRFFVLKVDDYWSTDVCRTEGRMVERTKYFDRLRRSLRDGGREALLALLLRRDITEFDVFTVPNTKELMRQKLQTLRGVMKWLYDCVYSGVITNGGWPTTAVSNAELFISYSIWCDNNHERKLSQIAFGRAVTKFLRVGGKQAQVNGQGVKAGKLRTPDEVKKTLPPLEVMNSEEVELLWSSGEWSSAVLNVSFDDE